MSYRNRRDAYPIGYRAQGARGQVRRGSASQRRFERLFGDGVEELLDEPAGGRGHVPAEAHRLALDEGAAVPLLEAPVGVEPPQKAAIVTELFFTLFRARRDLEAPGCSSQRSETTLSRRRDGDRSRGARCCSGRSRLSSASASEKSRRRLAVAREKPRVLHILEETLRAPRRLAPTSKTSSTDAPGDEDLAVPVVDHATRYRRSSCPSASNVSSSTMHTSLQRTALFSHWVRSRAGRKSSTRNFSPLPESSDSIRSSVASM